MDKKLLDRVNTINKLFKDGKSTSDNNCRIEFDEFLGSQFITIKRRTRVVFDGIITDDHFSVYKDGERYTIKGTESINRRTTYNIIEKRLK